MFLSLRNIKCYPILSKTAKIWPFTQVGVTDQVGSKLVILGIIWFGVMRQTHRYQSHSSITFGSKVMSRRAIFHRIIRNRSGRKLALHEVTQTKNPKYALCRYICSNISSISSESVKTFGLRLCPQHDFEVWSRSRGAYLTWPGLVTWIFDLRTTMSKFSHCAPRFLSYSRKQLGGGENLPIPACVCYTNWTAFVSTDTVMSMN